MPLKENLKGKLIKGAAQLAAAGIITRVLGLVNRMALSRLIAAEGLGLYQMMVPVYSLLAVIAGLGLSGAVTKMVADRYARNDRRGQIEVRRLALRLVSIAALACTALLWVALSFPPGFIPDRRIVFSMRLMPAAFYFAALSSVLRSFTQGQGSMAPTAWSQLAEQVVRVAVGLAAAFCLLPRGLEYALAGLMAGIICGELACFGVLYFTGPERKIRSASDGSDTGAILKEMCFLSLPILLIRLSTSVTQAVESMLIPARLQVAGFSLPQAAALFGLLSGMALPLVFLPTVLIIPVNTALVPAVAGAVTLRLRERFFHLVKLSLAGNLALGAVSAFILYLFAPFLTGALYGDTSAARLAASLAPVVPFAYLQFTTAAILHGMGRPGIAVANDLAGTLISLAIIFFLTAQPAWGIYGVVCGYTVAYIFIAVVDCLFIYFLARRV